MGTGWEGMDFARVRMVTYADGRRVDAIVPMDEHLREDLGVISALRVVVDLLPDALRNLGLKSRDVRVDSISFGRGFMDRP